MDYQLEIVHARGTNCYPSGNDAQVSAGNYRRQEYRSFGDNLLRADVLRHLIAA